MPGCMPTRVAQRAIKSVKALAPHSILFNNESRFGHRPFLGFACAKMRAKPEQSPLPSVCPSTMSTFALHQIARATLVARIPLMSIMRRRHRPRDTTLNWPGNILLCKVFLG
jgi:hypothetical protein